MVFVTGDVHGYFGRLERFCSYQGTTRDDVLVVLGDACINFWGDDADVKIKERIAHMPITMLCVHGNHEMRPATLSGYVERPWHGGSVYVEDAYPNLLFAKDGSLFDLEGASCLVAGGAYSVDKDWRLADGRRWFADEQPGPEEKRAVEQACERAGWRVDYVFSHTCPIEQRPTEAFLARVRQSTVDTSTEEWLSSLEQRLTFGRWMHGHFHTDRIGPGPFWALFKDVIELSSGRVLYTAGTDASYRARSFGVSQEQ
ncbi:MAG: metallophosphoesterase [Coriobacteriia bacterium]|nr:metallophosphoesterase [Coriobacteriia bacterium]